MRSVLKKTGILVGERDLSLERPALRKESYAKRVSDQRRREARLLHEDQRRAKYANNDDVLLASPSDEEDRFRRRRVRFVDEVS